VPYDAAVVKPAVSGASKGLRRATGGETVVADDDTMIQPLLASIADEGELSLLYAAGELSHTVRKVPAAGDIRSQPEFGSDVRLEPTPEEARDVARTVLDAVGRELPYARVDLVRAADGSLRLIELEVIEPQLYLRWDPWSPARFASAIAAVARSA
jgi:glutathione synthase/RimK-type ligase-like ATP-grasp enzyme